MEEEEQSKPQEEEPVEPVQEQVPEHHVPQPVVIDVVHIVKDDVKEEQEEKESLEEIAKPKIRCKRKKRLRTICIMDDDEDVNEEEEAEEYDDSCYEDITPGSSIQSLLTFQWENKTYEFEELCDPGTIARIFEQRDLVEEADLVDDVGSRKYVHICNTLTVAPMQRFINSLTSEEMDLSFRGIDGKNLRAMFMALETNTFVKKLILRGNKLTKDDCMHLGRTLNVNERITVLDLTSCGLGPEGVPYLVEYLTTNETLVELNLSKCNIQDEGVIPLAAILLRNNSIEKLDLSYNNLRDEAANALALAIKLNKAIVDLNLCYNKFYDPAGMKEFFRALGNNIGIENLNLSWNAMGGQEMGALISNFLKKNKAVKCLDLSDNRLEGRAIVELKSGLGRSRLQTLNLARNPMSPADMDVILNGAKASSYLLILNLEDLWANKSFLKILKKIPAERGLEVIVGGVYGNYELKGQDFAAILFKRANFEAQKPKAAKMKRDFGHLIWTLGDEPLTEEEFMEKVKKFKAKVADELIVQIMNFYMNKMKMIDVVSMRGKYLSVFPNSTPPPLPVVKEKPPEPSEGEEDFVTAVTAYADTAEQIQADEAAQSKAQK